MKVLWVTTFRSFGISKKNDILQKKFLKDLQKLNCKIKLSVTIFNEVNIKKNVSVKGIDTVFFKNKKKLPYNSKYSQSICMQNAMKLFEENYDCIIWSTADISIPPNLVDKIQSYREKDILMTVFPMHYVSSQNKIDSYSSNWGLDLFILKINTKEKVRKLKKIIIQCPNFGWGCYEHFFSSISDALNIRFINICKNLVIKKYNNDRKAFNDFRKNEIISWKMNQKYLLKYLRKNNLSDLFATGSMYYLIYKFFNLREMNYRLLLIYFKIFLKLPFNLIRYFLNKIFNL